MDIRKLQRAIVDGLEDVKAQNISIFNTEHLSALFERVIIASGTSNRQTKSLASSVREAVKGAGYPVPRLEGEANGEWIIIDCGAAVVHVMQPMIRDYYHLEEIWGEKPVNLKLGAAAKKLVKAAEPVDGDGARSPAWTARKARTPPAGAEAFIAPAKKTRSRASAPADAETPAPASTAAKRPRRPRADAGVATATSAASASARASEAAPSPRRVPAKKRIGAGTPEPIVTRVVGVKGAAPRRTSGAASAPGTSALARKAPAKRAAAPRSAARATRAEAPAGAPASGRAAVGRARKTAAKTATESATKRAAKTAAKTTIRAAPPRTAATKAAAKRPAAKKTSVPRG